MIYQPSILRPISNQTIKTVEGIYTIQDTGLGFERWYPEKYVIDLENKFLYK